MILLLSQLKNQFQDLVVETLCFLDSLREMELSKFFLLVVLFVYFDQKCFVFDYCVPSFLLSLITVFISFTSCVVCVLLMGPI